MVEPTMPLTIRVSPEMFKFVEKQPETKTEYVKKLIQKEIDKDK